MRSRGTNRDYDFYMNLETIEIRRIGYFHSQVGASPHPYGSLDAWDLDDLVRPVELTHQTPTACSYDVFDHVGSGNVEALNPR